MREIKFRAWDDINKKMWYPRAISANGSNCAYVSEFGVLRADYRLDTLMQFTGLKDKNGREIYEGDQFKTENDHFGAVEFDEDLSCFMARILPRKETTWERLDPLHYTVSMGIEIIGNIHENPSQDNH